MNQPTREEFDAFKAEMKAEVQQLRQRVTDEIKTVRVELSSVDVQIRLDNHTAFLQELDRKSDLHTRLINEMRVDMQKRFDAIAEVQRLILARLPEKE